MARMKTMVAEGDAVKSIRVALGLTQQDMASELKCAISSVQKMEGQNRMPRNRAVRDNLATMAERAGIEIQKNA
jgi:DNA-binding transcriptional regulator YiaG